MERGSLGQRKQGRKGKSSKYKGRDGEGITGAAETGKEGRVNHQNVRAGMERGGRAGLPGQRKQGRKGPADLIILGQTGQNLKGAGRIWKLAPSARNKRFNGVRHWKIGPFLDHAPQRFSEIATGSTPGLVSL
ncbi:hypothetical protein RRG08_034991 [Elysia crispata]|uniref:Uncharacterized protein n=1 Tax=Elysia crispata TaxID=231223 RepID=A0AAE0Y333_9GAST|nr:hypothetical protein RRG08_034991 [Elysia crispata]